jgi:hypothetical protein
VQVSRHDCRTCQETGQSPCPGMLKAFLEAYLLMVVKDAPCSQSISHHTWLSQSHTCSWLCRMRHATRSSHLLLRVSFRIRMMSNLQVTGGI